MKRTLVSGMRRLLRKAGLEVLYRADDPMLTALIAARETLRVNPDMPAWQRDCLLAQLPAKAHLQHLLRGFGINLVIDVGANQGQFALSLRQLGYTGRIVSFEPLAELCAALRVAAGRDAAWQIHQFALGDAPAELPLNAYRNSTLSSLHAVNATGRSRFPDDFKLDHVEAVTVRTLDDLAAGLQLSNPAMRILLKTDTQGHDLAVLQGARATLAHTAVVMSEASIQSIYDGAPTYQDIIRFLAGTGFSLSGIFPIAHSDRDFSLLEVDCCFVRVAPPTQP
jgi:FkbM family methyltransferase